MAALLGVSALLLVVSTGAASAGVSWTAVSAPLPADAVPGQGLTLGSTSCPVDGWCVGVGNYLAEVGGNYYEAGLIVTETGSSWSATEAPLPSNAGDDPQAYLESVSCGAVGSCVAVGRYIDASGATQGLVEQLSNSMWTASEVALPGNADATGSSAYAQLTNVACTSTGWCAAVGIYSPVTGGEQALVDTTIGANWSAATAAPLPAAAAGSQFLSLACPATGSCVAAGTYLVSGNFVGFAETLSAGTWTGATLPVPSGTSPAASIANNDLAVSCSTVGSCVIAGTTFDGNFEGLLDTLSAGTWSATAVAIPDGTPSSDIQLASVSCPASNACVATGFFVESGVEQGLIDTLASGTWTSSAAPTPAGTPAGADIEIYDVACPAAGTCVADGQSDVTGIVNGLFWNLSGGSWTVTATPLPSDAIASSDPSFAPIACPAAGVCVAVGTYQGSGGREGVLETDPSLVASTTTVTAQPVSTTTFSYSATVTGAAGPTGTVVFSSGLASLCTATISNGTASCTGPVPGSATILASYSGDGASAPSWATVVSSVAPTKIVAVTGSGQIVKVDTFFNSLQVKVTDAAGAGVPGVAVTFTAPATGASVVFWGPTTVLTNATGTATSSAISANDKKGVYSVTAKASGLATVVTFTLSNKKDGSV